MQCPDAKCLCRLRMSRKAFPTSCLGMGTWPAASPSARQIWPASWQTVWRTRIRSIRSFPLEVSTFAPTPYVGGAHLRAMHVAAHQSLFCSVGSICFCLVNVRCLCTCQHCVHSSLDAAKSPACLSAMSATHAALSYLGC